MNRVELGRKLSDLILGKKVEGKIAAVISNEDSQLRYVVDTRDGYLEIEFPKTRYYSSIVPLPPVFETELSRDQLISRRFQSVKPWTDGKVI